MENLWLCYKSNGQCSSCAYIQFWMHLDSWESTLVARVALGCASSNSYATIVLSQLSACIQNWIYAR